jgi:hypothetical protein
VEPPLVQILVRLFENISSGEAAVSNFFCRRLDRATNKKIKTRFSVSQNFLATKPRTGA